MCLYNHRWKVRARKLRLKPRCLILTSVCILFLAACLSRAGFGSEPMTARMIDHFQVEKVSMVEALLRLARAEHIPLAIEYVDRQALSGSIALKLGSTTIGNTLSAILRKAP